MNFLNIGPPEMILILILALIVFGPGKLPEIGRAVGKSIGEFRRATSDLTREISESVNEVKQPFDEMRELATGAIPGADGAKATTITCPACSVPNLSTSKFCRECGARLAQAEATVSCPQCAAANPASNKFCRECGTPLPAPADPPAEATAADAAQTGAASADETAETPAPDVAAAEREPGDPEAETPHGEDAATQGAEDAGGETENRAGADAVPEGAAPR